MNVTVQRYESSAVYSKVTEANGFVFTAGVIPTDLSRDVEGQTAEVLIEIDRLLALAGTDKSKLVTTNIWLADISTFAEMNAAWDAWVSPGNTPARATVEAKLAAPQYTVEIMVTAAL